MQDETRTEVFSWGELGEGFWRSAAEACTHKPSEAQLRFAVCKREGLTSSHAARLAGYAGSPESIRQNGSRANKSTAVQELLAYAHAETGTGLDGLVNGKEARRILSRIARTGDNTARIKACESLARMDRDERDANPNPCASHEEADSYRALEEVFGDDVAALIDAKMRYDAFVRDGGGNRPKVKPEDVFAKNSIDARIKAEAYLKNRNDRKDGEPID